MSDPFVAEIRIMGCNFAPTGWAFCDGQIMPIAQNTALFSLLGTNYGGNGTSTFALPNLQGRAPMGWGTGPGLSPRSIGQAGGSESVTLLPTEMPVHTHALTGTSTAATSVTPAANMPAVGARDAYAVNGSLVNLAPQAISSAGGSQPHNNMQPYLVMNFIIALQGIFPQRN